MKLNWGTTIVIAFVLFMAFILYFVIKVQTDTRYDHDLVVEEYYKQELTFQDRLDKAQHALQLTDPVEVEVTDDGIHIRFPHDFEAVHIRGKVHLYRPSNQKLDFEIPISLSNSHLIIPKSTLVDGRWDVMVDWSYNGTAYWNKQTVYLE